MLEKTPDDARSRSKDDPFQLPTEAASEFLAFEYSDEQWTEIEKSLRHLNPNQADLEKARRRLVSAARRYRAVMVNAPLAKARERWLARNWARVLKLSDELMSLLDRVGKGEAPRPPKPNGGPPADPLRAHKEALMKLNVVARGRMAAPRLDDGLPTAGPRAWFHLYVLETWTYLGGKLEYSRNRRNKIAGPLARYFAAATQPVHGGSPESLPDIVERHKAMLPALNRWRVSNLAVSVRDYLCLNEPLLVSELAQDVRDLLEFCESTADALAGEIDPDSVAEAVSEDMDKFGGAPDWIKQEDVQALVKEALKEALSG